MKRDGSGGTGHGTSLYMPVPLRVVLQRDRYQMAAKRHARYSKRHAARQGKRAEAAEQKRGLLSRFARALGLSRG
jgi:hypothetical protein